jgi:hypothetical protein
MKREIKGPDDPNSSTVQYMKITRHSATPETYLADRGSQHLTFEVTFSPLSTVTTKSRELKMSPPDLDQHVILFLDIWYICQLQLGRHPVAVVQNTFTYKQYTGRQNTNNTQNHTNMEGCGPCPVFASYTLAFCLTTEENHGKTSVRVAKECQLARWMHIIIQ